VSTASAMRRAFAVQVDRVSPAFREAAAPPDVESSLERLTTWVPTEVVGIYISLVGLFLPASDAGRWALFLIGVVLVPAFVGVNSALVNKRGAAKWRADQRPGDPPRVSLRQVGLCVAVALVAYIAWSMALPNTPFLAWFDDAPRLGGGLVVVLALILPKVAELLDISLPQT
jgi:hypothetical protein